MRLTLRLNQKVILHFSINHVASFSMINALELLLSANAGNRASYAELLSWLSKHAEVQIKRNLRNYHNFPAQGIDDILQDVLITFHQTHQTFDSSRPLLPWINSIIKYKSIDFLRRKEFRVTMTSVEVETIKEEWHKDDEEENNQQEELLHLIESLPPEQKEVLKLAKLEGFSGKEIAFKLNITESNVKVIIHRAIKHIKKTTSSSK